MFVFLTETTSRHCKFKEQVRLKYPASTSVTAAQMSRTSD